MPRVDYDEYAAGLARLRAAIKEHGADAVVESESCLMIAVGDRPTP